VFLSRTFSSSGKYAYANRWHLLAVEWAGGFMVMRGIAYIYWPAALIIGGIAVIVAVEVRG
jgi:hypothetical protein